jgi:hypothetical protein
MGCGKFAGLSLRDNGAGMAQAVGRGRYAGFGALRKPARNPSEMGEEA